MRFFLSLVTGFFVLLSVLCLIQVAMSIPDQSEIIRWMTAGIGLALIAVFWGVLRRRYIASGALAADVMTTVLGVAGLGILIMVMAVFRLTAG